MIKQKQRALKKKEDFFPKKHWGQNFLISQNKAEEFANLAEINPEDSILEVGAGMGIITKILAKRAKKVLALEKDKDLIPLLKENLKEFKNVEIIVGDVRDFLSHKGRKGCKGFMASMAPTASMALTASTASYKIVANLPFYLSTFFLRKALELPQKPSLMILGLQKELVERILSETPKMSFLGIMTRTYGNPKAGPIIKKEFFQPSPKVDVQILVIKEIKESKDLLAKKFLEFVKSGFLHPRKKLISNLQKKPGLKKEKIEKVFKSLEIGQNIRAQELTMGQWKELYKKIQITKSKCQTNFKIQIPRIKY